MEKRTKKNLSRMTMIIAAFLLVTAIGVGVWAATSLTRTAGTTVNYTANLGVELTVTAQKYDEDAQPIAASLQTLAFTYSGTAANDFRKNGSGTFDAFDIADDEYVIYTFTFKLNGTKYIDADNAPYDISYSGNLGLTVEVESGEPISTLTTTNQAVVFKVSGSGGTAISANITFTCIFGA